jgi:hypothetical protein
MMAVEVNRAKSEREGSRSVIDYVLDDGNQYKKHILQFHDAIHKNSDLAEFRVGALTFNTDTNVPALQAADVVAWASRRRKAGMPMTRHYEPLNRLFDDCYADSPAPEDVMKVMSERFALVEKGIVPAPLTPSGNGFVAP